MANTETEVKIRVEDLSVIDARLKELGATLIEDLQLVDSYYDNGKLFTNGHFLRIRNDVQDISGFEFTYKGPIIESRNGIKTRPEYNFRIEDPDRENILDLLKIVDCELSVVIDKVRTSYSFCNCIISLDKICLLGSFVEIEGDNVEDINYLIKLFDIEDLPVEELRYAELMREFNNEN